MVRTVGAIFTGTGGAAFGWAFGRIELSSEAVNGLPLFFASADCCAANEMGAGGGARFATTGRATNLAGGVGALATPAPTIKLPRCGAIPAPTAVPTGALSNFRASNFWIF